MRHHTISFVLFCYIVLTACSNEASVEINKTPTHSVISSTIIEPGEFEPIDFDWSYYMGNYHQPIIWDYYQTDVEKIEMRYLTPYSYIRHKYLDLFIDFFASIGYIYGVDPVYISEDWITKYPYNLGLYEKCEFVEQFITEQNENFENSDLYSQYGDEYCDRLAECMNAEMNTMDEIISLIQEVKTIVQGNDERFDLQSLIDDPVIDVCGNVYHKLDALAYYEYDGTMPHQQTECDECSPNYAPQYAHINSRGVQRILRYNLHALWGKKIRYRDYSCPDIGAAQSQMIVWQEATDNYLQFVQIKDNGWNRFTWGIGCNYHLCLSSTSNSDIGGSSSIGCVPWATIKINPNGSDEATYLHELGHTLGLFHEIQRCDRDEYVNILCDNIKCGYKSNFHKTLHSTATPYGDFDFESIMMYGSTAFAAAGKQYTITKKDGSTFQRKSHLSEGDIANIKYLYHP